MHPHLAVIGELVRRGHRVSYLVGGHLAELARPTGADVIGYHPTRSAMRHSNR
jgi:UDP:flavonoid glycosyltransferase YjiC (YdhE family)